MNFFRKIRHTHPDLSRRAVTDRSGREIADLQAHFGHELRSFLYFYDEMLVLAAPLSGTPGNVNAELRDPVIAREPVSDERLGYMALESLLGYESGPIPSMKARKMTDWPTYQASGASSIKEFNRRTVGVMLETVYGSIRIEAWTLIPNENRFAVRTWASISELHIDLGATLRKIVVGAKSLQSAGVI